MDIHGVKGDLYQVTIVTKYEIIKNLRSKKLYLYLGLIVLILVLMTAMPYVFGDGLPKDPKDFMSNYAGWVSTVIMIGVPLFAASALSSEFEERTALLMFTRPIKKETIFLGKFIASFIIAAVGVILYYAVSIVLSLAITGSINSDTMASFGLALLFVFGATGLSLMLSAIFKRSTNAIIISIFALILILPMVSTILIAADIKPWFELSFASGSIQQVIAQSTDFNIGGGLNIIYKYPEIGISAVVMVVWGLITSILALIKFKIREF